VLSFATIFKVEILRRFLPAGVRLVGSPLNASAGDSGFDGVEVVLGGVFFLNEVDYGLGGSSGEEDFCDAGLLEGGNVGAGDDATYQNGYVVHALFVEQIHELGANGVVGAGEDREADYVDVFLNGGGGDHFRGLAKAGVDDFHAGVAEGAGDNFCAAVVAIEARFGDKHANFLSWHVL